MPETVNSLPGLKRYIGLPSVHFSHEFSRNINELSFERAIAAVANFRVLQAQNQFAPIFLEDEHLAFLCALPKSGTAQGFTGTTTFQMPKGSVHFEELDNLPNVTPKSPVVYPTELKGSGIIGRISGFALLRADGSVEFLDVTSGNDQRFRKPVEEATKHWKFSPPMKDSHAVGAYVQFQVVVSERSKEGPFLVGAKKKSVQQGAKAKDAR